MSRREPRLVAEGCARTLSGYDRAEDDWYPEDRDFLEAMLDMEEAHFGGFPGTSWDPCCGEGNIPRTLQARGLACRGSDLVRRGYGRGGIDFLAGRFRPVDHIICNPPFDLSKPWAFRALDLARGKVVLFHRWAWFESVDRDDLFGRGLKPPTPIARIYLSARRVSCPPGGFGITRSGGKTPYAWYIWDRRHKGPPITMRL